MKLLEALAGVSMTALALSTPALAQSDQSVAAEGQAEDIADPSTEIVVTGTQIRGVAPAGVQVLGVGEDQITALGAASGQDVLRSLPQVANMFQNAPAPGNSNAIFADRLPVSRPNLRSLPNINLASIGFTLVMVDGHRMTPIGIQYAGIDAEAVPSSTLQRVEVMPDGASAIYGSDAVAGVINFITRDKFDGVRFSGHAGMSEGYWAYDANLTVGKTWDTGGIYASYSRAQHDWILGSERDFIQGIDWNSQSPTYGQFVGLRCAAPNISFAASGGATRYYPLTGPGGAIQPPTTNGGSLAGTRVGGGNRCDITDTTSSFTGGDQSYYPKQKRDGVQAGFTQEFSDRLKLDVRGFWNRTSTLNSGGAFQSGVTVTAANPNYRNVNVLPVGSYNPADAGATQTVLFNWEPIFGNRSRRLTTSEWWQVTSQLTWKIGDRWQVRALGSYGKSTSESQFEVLDSRAATGVQARVTAGLINPYNLPASAPTAFDNLVQVNKRYGKFRFTNARIIADGPVFDLPGGDARVAVGAEYTRTKLLQNLTTASFVYDPALETAYTQTVKSLFGEVQLPLVSDANAFPGVYSFQISASLRHDRYNDFGNTTNPSIGVTYRPVEWIKLRGNWNKSFTAPSAGDQIGKQLVSLTLAPSGFIGFPLPQYGTGPAPFPSDAAIVILNQGTVGGVAGDPASLKPQTSNAWSLGFDIEPPFVPGLKLGLSYYNLSIKDLISGPGAPQQIISQYPGFIYCHSTVAGQLGAPSNTAAANCLVPLSPAEVAKYVAGGSAATIISSGLVTGGANADYLTGAKQVAYVMDIRSRNLGGVRAQGLDFQAQYTHDTSWGSFDAAFTGNYQLSMKTDSGPGTAIVDALAFDAPRLRWSTTLGVNSGGFRGQVTWDHSGGYDLKPGVGNSGGTAGTATVPCSGACGQSRVGAFNTVDLFLKYKFGDYNRLTKGLTLTLNVDNVFNARPPVLMSGLGFANGFTVGRFVQLGLIKDF